MQLLSLPARADAEEEYTNTDECESEGLNQQTDPLMTRRLPTSTDFVSSEKDDTLYAGEERITIPHPAARRSFRPIPLRIAMIMLAILILLALLVNAFFISTIFTHKNNAKTSTLPMLTVTPGVAHPGQMVLLHMRHFSPSSRVLLTHDIQQLVQTDTGSPLILVGSTGSADVHVLVDNSWGAGKRIIEGEDATTHYTTSTTILITGSGSTGHALLVLNQTSLEMGADLPGTRTVQPLVLRNGGGGSIAWKAASDQPWLMATPAHGIFSESQSIAIAVTRANLTAGKEYSGTITIIPNTGNPASVRVKMTVLPQLAHQGTVQHLSFSYTQGRTSPAEQEVTLTNTGGNAVSWHATIMSSASSWLSINPPGGTIATGQFVQLGVSVNPAQLSPGSYTAQVEMNATDSSGMQLQMNPQTLIITLSVFAPCAMQVTPSSLSFSAILLQPDPADQSITLKEAGNCAQPVLWSASVDQSWVSLAKTSGTGNGSITVHINSQGMLPGSYSAYISISASDSEGTSAQANPLSILVTLNVSA